MNKMEIRNFLVTTSEEINNMEIYLEENNYVKQAVVQTLGIALPVGTFTLVSNLLLATDKKMVLVAAGIATMGTTIYSIKKCNNERKKRTPEKNEYYNNFRIKYDTLVTEFQSLQTLCNEMSNKGFCDVAERFPNLMNLYIEKRNEEIENQIKTRFKYDIIELEKRRREYEEIAKNILFSEIEKYPNLITTCYEIRTEKKKQQNNIPYNLENIDKIGAIYDEVIADGYVKTKRIQL